MGGWVILGFSHDVLLRFVAGCVWGYSKRDDIYVESQSIKPTGNLVPSPHLLEFSYKLARPGSFMYLRLNLSAASPKREGSLQDCATEEPLNDRA